MFISENLLKVPNNNSTTSLSMHTDGLYLLNNRPLKFTSASLLKVSMQ